MITDTFENFEKYINLHKNFRLAYDYISKNNLSEYNCGKYEILGDKVYLSVDEYTTKKSSKPEYHKKYIDIQFVLNGEEKIGYCPLSKIKKDDDFNEEKDIGFGMGEPDFIHMQKGTFMILFPNDAHQPCMATGEPQKVKKVVIKVKIEE